MKILIAILPFLLMTVSCSAHSVTVSIDQATNSRPWRINNLQVSEVEMSRMLNKLASLDTNQIVQVVAHTNVPASTFVQTLGIIHRAGFQKIILVSSGTDNSTNGTWCLSADLVSRGMPGCLPIGPGFTTQDIKSLDVEIEPYLIKEEPPKGDNRKNSGPAP